MQHERDRRWRQRTAGIGVSLLLAASTWAPAGCGSEDAAPCVMVIDQDITAQTTWRAGCVHVIERFDLRVRSPLTIEAGAIVKFHGDKGPDLVLGDEGVLVAKGTAAQPIVFTSWRDDAHGGDTNGDGATTQAASGDWGAVNLNGQSGSIFEHCQFLYGGKDTYKTTLSLATSRATVRDSLFAHNKGGKTGCCYYGALHAGDALEGTVVSGNVFFDNDLPLSFDTTFSLDDSNTFHNPVAPAETNRLNGAFLEPSGEIDTAIGWGETEVAIVVNDNDLWVNAPGSLTLGQNVVVKFVADGTLVYTGSNIVDHDGADVHFTSLQDDTLKGDTNGDGGATTPADGDWEGIYRDVPSGVYEAWGNIHYDSH